MASVSMAPVAQAGGARRAGTSGGMLQPGRRGSVRRSAVLCRMLGLVRSGLPLGRVTWWRVHRDRAPGDSPARYLHGYPSMGRGPLWPHFSSTHDTWLVHKVSGLNPWGQAPVQVAQLTAGPVLHGHQI